MAKVSPADAPGQQTMAVPEIIQKHFAPHDALIVKQTMRGCLQECMGCEAKSEFKVAPFDMKNLNGYAVNDQSMDSQWETMYAIEKSSFCCRCCWRDGRPFVMNVSQGGNPGGADIVQFKKPCGFPLVCDLGDYKIPCCCLLPKVDTLDASGNPLGSTSEYKCDMCLYVPKFKYSENQKPVYILKPETCCGGCCVACNPCTGKGFIYVPFYFHDPSSMAPIGGGYSENSPQIRKVWAGFKKECCSTADTFVVKFPDNIDAGRKAALLGMTFLIDFTWFERQQEKK